MMGFDKDKMAVGPKNFKYLDELIHSGAREIVLDSDIILSDGEESKYLEGIKLDVDDLTIDGNGHTIDACGKTRIFYCIGKNILIRNIRLKNGYAEFSGAILNKGELKIIESIFCNNNTAKDDGGAICNDMDLIISQSLFKRNTAKSSGYAIVSLNRGNLKLIDCVFKNNPERVRDLESDFKNILYRFIDDSRIKKIEKRAWEIYGNAIQDELIKDMGDRLVIATCLYIACRENKEPYDMVDIADAAHIDSRNLRRAFGIITRKLNLKLEPTSPLVYIPRFSSDLEVSQKAQSKAIEITEKAIEKGIVLGKNPKGVAAAAIYLACESLGERIEQRKISDIVGITEITIRLRCEDLTSLVK